MHYKISYLSDWKMYQGAYGPPSSVLLSKCDGNDDVVFASGDMWIKPPGVKYFDIEISNQERLDETIYKGSKTLDEYFIKNPLILKTSPIVKETTINGERVVWLNDLPSPYFMFFHNGILFKIDGYNLNPELFNDFLSTFKFVD